MIVMAVFSAVSTVFGAASAIALFSTFLGTRGVPPAVYVAATFCTIISVHQMISLFFTLGLLQRLKQGRSQDQPAVSGRQADQHVRPGQQAGALGAADQSAFIAPLSVSESTTELLEPAARVARRENSS